MREARDKRPHVWYVTTCIWNVQKKQIYRDRKTGGGDCSSLWICWRPLNCTVFFVILLLISKRINKRLHCIVAACRFPLGGELGLLFRVGFSLGWLLSFWRQALEHRLRSCDAWALVALWQVGSSQSRDRTMSAVVSGRFLSTVPPGKPYALFF